LWIDGLDVPLVFALNGPFIEEFSQPQQPVKRIVRTVADGPEGPDGSTWYFKGPETRARLRELSRSVSLDDNAVYEYRHPDGRPTLPTMLCGMQLLRPGEATRPLRRTSVGIYSVVTGRGTTVVGDTTFTWDRGDALVVPNWTWHRHENRSAEDAMLFFMSDRPLLEATGLYREESSAAGESLV
jgi:gentisate 1,2-dioxygenase